MGFQTIIDLTDPKALRVSERNFEAIGRQLVALWWEAAGPLLRTNIGKQTFVQAAGSRSGRTDILRGYAQQRSDCTDGPANATRFVG